MAILPIITGEGHPILRKRTAKVPRVTKEVQRILRDMEETAKNAKGAGLAAPQIGESLRLCIAMINGKHTPLINPEIIWRSAETARDQEACLSLPDIVVPVTRPLEIAVRYLDERGQEQERKLKGWDARVVQHEIDHLDGILIVDYIETPMRLPLAPR